jgi:SAM-dependent methyltransferase
MNDWNAGYVTDIGYTYGCYPELNPMHIDLAFLQANLAFAPTSYACELGFGQGLSINANAAASGVTWYGNDFNPSQAAFARELAAASGAKAHLSDESFATFCARTDLPDFDFIAMHGIWSWISDANRAIIVDFIGRKLKPGGVLYVTYNAQPGWAPMVPVRDLMTDHVALMGAPGQAITQKVDAAMGFVSRLMATNPSFAKSNPQMAQRLQDMQNKDRAYLAHEYFNRDWAPMSFSAMASAMAEAKMSFACSANYIDQLPQYNFTPEQLTMLSEIADPVFRESVRDFFMNTQFRRDYWVKGPRPLGRLKQADGLLNHRVQLARPRSKVPLKASAGLGELDLAARVYEPVLDVLADYHPRAIKEILAAVKVSEISLPELLQVVLVLSSTGALVKVQDDASILEAQATCDAFNRFVCEQSRSNDQLRALASPVTGSGVAAGRFHQLFLLARSSGAKSTKDLAKFVWTQMKNVNQFVISKGNQLQSEGENLDHLEREARTFIEVWLPLYIAQKLTPAEV